MKSIGRAAAVVLVLAVITAGGALLWRRYAPRSTPPGQPPLATLDAASLPGLRDAFNAHAREARLLVLLSPT